MFKIHAMTETPDEFGHHHELYSDLGFRERTIAFVPVRAWCAEHFGPMQTDPKGSRWFMCDNTIWFADDHDAVAFRMRWG